MQLAHLVNLEVKLELPKHVMVGGGIKMSMRWSGDTFDYGLQIKSRSNYGEGEYIRYAISTLWDNDINAIILR